YLRHSLTARSRFAPNGTMTKPAPRVIVERPSALASLQAKMAITQAPADATRSPNVHCPSSPCLTNEAYSRRLSPTPPRTRRRREEGAGGNFFDVGTTLSTLQTLPATGLTGEVARTRLETYGPNKLPEPEPRSVWEVVSEQVSSLPVALLTAAAGISLFTGGLADAVIIMGVVAINATIGYVTESQSDRTIRSLRNLTRPSATVVRDQVPAENPGEEVVPGDIPMVKPGTYIAASCRLIEARCLTVDESALTGESLPVNKIAGRLTDGALPLADRVNMVYMGTL